MSTYGTLSPSSAPAHSSFVDGFESEAKESKKGLATIAGFVLCGTTSTIMSKILYQHSAVGSDGEMHMFQKPLFQNCAMFLGMSLCLIVYALQQACKPSKRGDRMPLTAGAQGQEKEKEGGEGGFEWNLVYLVAVPATCDFIATYLLNIGLLWINASVWQMLRGSEVFFSALIRYVTLKKAPTLLQWYGVILVTIALGLIGYACMQSEAAQAPLSEAGADGDAAENDAQVYRAAIGMFLVVISQFVQASQSVFEEYLLHDAKASELIVVGLEGLWGFFLGACVAMPLASMSMLADPDNTFHALYEDTQDSFAMLANSSSLLGLLAIYSVAVLMYNVLAMKITLELDSVTRNILDTLRTVFIWVLVTLIHYYISTSFGEAWNTPWSYLQLFGFGVLIFGLFTYNHIVLPIWSCLWPLWECLSESVCCCCYGHFQPSGNHNSNINSGLFSPALSTHSPGFPRVSPRLSPQSPFMQLTPLNPPRSPMHR